LPGCGHAERALQASWWQEHGAAHAGGPRAQQASKLETRALFAGSQGGTVARAGGNAYGPLSARLDLKAPRSRGRIRTTRTIYLTGRTHSPVAAVPEVAHFAPSVAPMAHTSPARTSPSAQLTLSVPVTMRTAAGGPGSPFGPGGPAVPTGPCGPAEPRSPAGPVEPCPPASPCGPCGPTACPPRPAQSMPRTCPSN
jgi:hypothetical protein